MITTVNGTNEPMLVQLVVGCHVTKMNNYMYMCRPSADIMCGHPPRATKPNPNPNSYPDLRTFELKLAHRLLLPEETAATILVSQRLPIVEL